MTTSGDLSASSAQKVAQDIKCDPYYDDPAADIVFCSTNNVHFRITSWLLGKHRWVTTLRERRTHASTFFADLRKDATQNAGRSELIQTELPDATLKKVLGLFTAPRCTQSTPTITFPSVKSAFDMRSFLDKFAFDDAKVEIEKGINEAAKKDPWAYFRFSATVNDSSTAHVALGHMSREHLGEANFWPWVHDLPHDWRLAFLVAVFDTATPQIKKTATTIALQASPLILSTRFVSELKRLQLVDNDPTANSTTIGELLKSSHGLVERLKRRAGRDEENSGSSKKSRAKATGVEASTAE